MELTKIKGISEKRKEDFNKLGIFDTADLTRYFPRAYIDLREKQMLKNVYHNDFALTIGKVLGMPMRKIYGKSRGFVKVSCEQDGLIFSIVWFNQPYVMQKLVSGGEYLFYGRVSNRYGEISMVNPTFEPVDKTYRLKGIVPQYSLKGNLTQKIVRDSVRLSVDLEKPSSAIPKEELIKYGLTDLYTAYKTAHNPLDFEELKKASDRIAVEEYFALISAFKFIKGDKTVARTNVYACSSKNLIDFIYNAFPFEFTEGQKKAVNEIYSDMTGTSVMNRLMQGDVGSGKTAVALCALFIAVKSRYQAVMLAPTEVLARQNYEIAKKILSGFAVGLLVGSMTKKEKTEIKEKLKSKEIDVLVGTHAVLEADVEFANLSLCVCDEQQRFGVAQRSNLMSKGVAPDVLVMSATPIPRTMSLIFYGDLDITTIKDKPKERASVKTYIVPKKKYDDMLKFVSSEINKGNRAYFVCPKIDGDEEGTDMSVTELFSELKEKLPDIKIGLLHGRMKDVEKNLVMESFKNGDIELLVSTTVIEVGVDVPEATIMVICDAERFGLSQLHQLRGRVGRSDRESYCFLFAGKEDRETSERLNVIKNNSDGFKISECDFEMRGAGDFLGTHQSGKMPGDLGNLRYSAQSVFLAKKISDEVLSSGMDLSKIKEVAMKKYDKLKDVTLN